MPNRASALQSFPWAGSLAQAKVLGDPSVEVTPVPIPNTAVKLHSPDGTAREIVWESRTLPDYKHQPRLNPRGFRVSTPPPRKRA